jgi:Tol biopolymer transport system component
VLFVFIIVVASLGDGVDEENKMSASGGAGQEHKKSTSGGSASTDGQIVFRRYLGLELTPDGRRHPKRAIFTMYPNGSHIRQITHPPEGFSDDSPVWSPDGTKVAFNRQEIDESTNHIMVLNTKTGDARQVSASILQGRVVRGMEGSDPAFSPEGNRLAFKQSDGIWIVGLDGSDPHQVSNVQKRGALEFEDFGPAFSPDGDRLVFERTRLEDERHAVFVQRIDSSGSPEDARQITPWDMNCEDGPEFSPNGNWLLFSCEGEGGSSNLYMGRPDGTAWLRFGLERLTNSPGDVDYVGSSFSPKFHDRWGDIVAARYPGYGDEGNSDVFGMHIEHGVQETVNLTESETLEDAPSWGTPEGAR